MGRGVAYAAREFPYLLNVPAARLSADSRDPLQFLRFAQRRVCRMPMARTSCRAPCTATTCRMCCSRPNARRPRRFGCSGYLARSRTSSMPTAVRHLTAQFADRESIAGRHRHLGAGQSARGAAAVGRRTARACAFRQDPRDLPQTSPRAAIGTDRRQWIDHGGCGVGVEPRRRAGAHAAHDFAARLVAEARRRCFMRAPCEAAATALLGRAASLRRVLKASRAMAREVEKLGGDWREAVAFIRNLAPSLWRRLPEVERRRFVRHLQVHWDIYRHRMPPQLMARIDHLRRCGKLHVSAGRIRACCCRGRAAASVMAASRQRRPRRR